MSKYTHSHSSFDSILSCSSVERNKYKNIEQIKGTRDGERSGEHETRSLKKITHLDSVHSIKFDRNFVVCRNKKFTNNPTTVTFGVFKLIFSRDGTTTDSTAINHQPNPSIQSQKRAHSSHIFPVVFRHCVFRVFTTKLCAIVLLPPSASGNML